ncbi:hypothetical protein CPB85DRAFT_577056 [Mucidula mucida]|nr:hypothetical protein CPB85DRAFT_577056 [Mucidula mucida]
MLPFARISRCRSGRTRRRMLRRLDRSPRPKLLLFLAKRWTDGNDRSKADWDAQVAPDKVAADAAEDQRLAAEKLAEAAADRVRKDALQAIIDKKPQLGVFDSNTKAPDFVHSLVHLTALKLVQARRYVSLMYWTPDALKSAADLDASAADDAVADGLRVLLGQEPVSRKFERRPKFGSLDIETLRGARF